MSFSFCLTLQLIKSPTHSEPVFRVSLSLTFFYRWGFRACQNLWREVTWIQPGPQKSGSDTLTARLLLAPITRQTSGRSLSLGVHLLLHPYSRRRSCTTPGPGSAKEEADLFNAAGLRNLRAPISIINLESLTKGTVQPDASQQISLTGSPQPPKLRLQGNPGGRGWFWGGGQYKGRGGAGISKFCSRWKYFSVSRSNLALCF